MKLKATIFIFLMILPLITTAAELSPQATWMGGSQYPEGSAWTVQIVSSNSSGTKLVLECPGFYAQPVQQNGTIATQVVLPQAGMTAAIGLPELPAICKLLAIPNDRQPEVIIHQVEYQAYPCDNPVIVQSANGQSSLSRTSQSLAGNIYPQEWADVQDPAIFKDYRVAPLNLYPLRYDPAKRELLLATRMEVELKTQAPSTVNVKTFHTVKSHAFDELYDALIDNRGSFNSAVPLVSEGPRGAYAIFIHDDYIANPYFTQFVEWKRQLGYQVTVVPLSSVGSNQDQIEAKIRDLYFNGSVPLDYVLLVGDVTGSTSIPTYYVQKPGGGEQDVTDHPYTLMEGSDYFPEIMIGRISIQSSNELVSIMNKMLKYQKSPTTSTDWFTQALVAAGNYSDTGIAPITPVWTSLWLMEKLYDYGYTDVDTVFYWRSPPNNWSTDSIAASINEGVSLVAYRGWADESGWQYPKFDITDIEALQNGLKLPVVVSIVCETGNFGDTVDPCFGEAWIRVGTVTTPKGGVTFYGPSDLHTNTKWNNALYAGFFEGMLEENLYRLGQAATRSKMELYYGFPENTATGDFAWFYFHVYNILGDPELPMWTNFPADITLDAPDQIVPGRQVINATVTNASGSPLGGAYVAFYKENSVLAGGIVSGNGTVAVEIEPNSAGQITVTASKQNYQPRQEIINVVINDFPLGIYGLYVDGDGIASSGELVTITVVLHNYGTSALTGVEAELSTNDANVTITQSSASPGTIAATGSANAEFDLEISPDCPDQYVVEFTLDLSDDATHTNTIKFVLTIGGWQLIPAGIVMDDLSMEPGEDVDFFVLLFNNGTLTPQNLTGTLSCSDASVSVITAQASFPAISPGTSVGSSTTYTVGIDASAPVGKQVIFNLLLMEQGEIIGDVSIPVQIGQPGTDDPLGPDTYGYYMYDDTDIAYGETPQYNWIELDPNYGTIPSTHHPLSDDESVAVELPFPFTYYGIEYDSLTICSNGWLSMGTTWMANFRNWNLPSALGPPALIAPFWDDLKADTSNGKPAVINVYTYFDNAEDYFIIEWSRCLNRFGYENLSTWKEETFEVILYDPAAHPTETGDGEMLFQYQVVNDVDDNNNYATVGIEDEGHVRGLQYAYSNDYPTTAAVLQDNRAIKITTDPPQVIIAGDHEQGEVQNDLWFDHPSPNPANPSATLRFSIPREGKVALDLYNTLGQKVAVLLNKRMESGPHQVQIQSGHLSSGIYIAALRFEKTVLNLKVLILK